MQIIIKKNGEAISLKNGEAINLGRVVTDQVFKI